MTAEEREKMTWLCEQIAIEKDPIVFDRLVTQLNALLEVKHSRIHSKPNIENE